MLNVEYQAASMALMAAARESNAEPTSEAAIETAINRLEEFGLARGDAWVKVNWAAGRFKLTNRDEVTERMYKKAAGLLGRA